MTTHTFANPGYGPEITESIPVRLAATLNESGQTLTDCGGVPLSVPDAGTHHLVTAATHVHAAHDQLVRALAALSGVPQGHPARPFVDQEFVALTALKNRAAGAVEAMENRGVCS